MLEQPKEVQGYGAAETYSTPLVLTQSVTPSLGEVQTQQGPAFFYESMAAMFGTGMAAAKAAYIFIQKKKNQKPDPQDVKKAMMQGREEKIKIRDMTLQKEINKGNEELDAYEMEQSYLERLQGLSF